MKKVLLLSLTALLAVSLTACGVKKGLKRPSEIKQEQAEKAAKESL